jgi:hypothetical protein
LALAAGVCKALCVGVALAESDMGAWLELFRRSTSAQD